MMENNLGRVHSIETFGTVDGPGIRFVVFMQGCPLKCMYCHNRDTWEVNAGNLTNVDDLVAEIKRYIPYIESSNGGVTVSGGEPLLQAKFVTCLFKKLQELIDKLNLVAREILTGLPVIRAFNTEKKEEKRADRKRKRER